MSGLLTREGLSDLLRREALAGTPVELQGAHDALRILGVCPTLPAMPVDRGRRARVDAARAAAPKSALDVLGAAGARLPGSEIRIEGRYLYVGDQLVATAAQDDDAVFVTAAYVFDGFMHGIPDGCDTSVTKVAAHRDPVGRVLAAIELRQTARATSLPVPAGDPGRDPSEVSHAA